MSSPSVFRVAQSDPNLISQSSRTTSEVPSQTQKRKRQKVSDGPKESSTGEGDRRFTHLQSRERCFLFLFLWFPLVHSTTYTINRKDIIGKMIGVNWSLQYTIWNLYVLFKIKFPVLYNGSKTVLKKCHKELLVK